VRLDDEAEKTLAKLKKVTGLSISEVLKRGLSAYPKQAMQQADRNPLAIYHELELGEGGYAIAPARRSQSATKAANRRKHKR
jgi:hypothetical protein